MSFFTSGNIVIEKQMMNEVITSFNNAENVYIIGRSVTGKTSFLAAMADYLTQQDYKVIFAPKLSPPKYGLRIMYEQVVGKLEKVPSRDVLIEKLIEVFRETPNLCLLLDDLDRAPPTLHPFLATLLDLSLKLGSPRVLAAGNEFPKNESIYFYFSKKLEVKKLTDLQAALVIDARYPNMDPDTKKEVIHMAHGQPVALLQLAKQAFGKVTNPEFPHAANQFVFEMMPIGLLLIFAYALIALRFLLYWEAQLALVFIFIYALRGSFIQFSRWARWKKTH